ncbi:MAG TPA: hypothetical protein VLB02_00590 [Candidatus Paceibacterota bacterium]|nr:hypothetical protein [Candidatus Paceibacterota bacterium]
MERNEKIELRIKELAALFFGRESNRTALITVTRVVVADRGRSAMIYVTVLPESAEAGALSFAKRKRAELREFVKEQLNIHPIPFLDVTIDSGEKARHTIDVLLKEE